MMNKQLMNSVSSIALAYGARYRRMFPKKTVFIRRLGNLDDMINGVTHTVYQAVDEFGNEVQSYGGDFEFAFKTAKEDTYLPRWAH
jgi:hypothetical protein